MPKHRFPKLTIKTGFLFLFFVLVFTNASGVHAQGIWSVAPKGAKPTDGYECKPETVNKPFPTAGECIKSGSYNSFLDQCVKTSECKQAQQQPAQPQIVNGVDCGTYSNYSCASRALGNPCPSGQVYVPKEFYVCPRVDDPKKDGNSCSSQNEVIPYCGVPTLKAAQANATTTGYVRPATPFKFETQLPFLKGKQAPDSPAAFVNYLFIVGLSLGALLAFFMIVLGGVQYAMAGANPGWQKEATDKIRDALLGLLLLLASYLILKTVNPDLINLKNPSLEPAKGQEEIRPPAATSTLGIQPVIGLISPGWDRGWTFASANIEYQKIHASGPLQTLLTCMGSYFDASGVNRSTMTITSISDSNILAGTCEPGTRNTSGCQHVLEPIPSCHYGGVNGFDAGSFAFDTDPGNRKFKTEAANACGAKVANEGNHLHVTIGHRYASCDLFFGE